MDCHLEKVLRRNIPELLDIYCVIDGITTRIVVEDTAPNAINMKIRAFSALSDRMIDLGFPTQECSCCLDPKNVSVEILSSSLITDWGSVTNLHNK